MEYRRLMNECPAVIGMITSVLQSGGSIDTSVRDISKSGPRYSRELFGKAVWMADTKQSPSVRQALSEVVNGLPQTVSGYTRAVLMALSASDSSDKETMDRMLRDSAEIALESVKTMGESYGASLTVPCMTVFGLGIMVPMILMSILPMLGIGGMFGSRAIDQGTITIITLVLIPSAISAVALYVRNRNPFLVTGSSLSDLKYAVPLLASIPLAVVCPDMGRMYGGTFLFALLPACLASAFLMYDAIRYESSRIRCEQSLKDTVFDLGNRMLSGENFETASVESIAGREACGELSKTLSREYRLCRGDIPSAITKAVEPISAEMSIGLRNIRLCSEKDNDDAGRLAVTLGKQFQNRASAQKELELKLKSTTYMMVGTAMFFAPMVLGMSVSMLEPLSHLTGFDSQEGTCMILGTYLVELCALISVLVSSLGNGENLMKMVWRFCYMCPVSLIVFTLCSSLSF